MKRELPEGGEWAEGPLLREENVGKYVWEVHNFNVKHAAAVQIVKIGRTNVHLRRSRPTSIRVNENGETAEGQDSGGFGISCHTEAWRLDAEVRRGLLAKIPERQTSYLWRQVSTDKLRAIVEILS